MRKFLNKLKRIFYQRQFWLVVFIVCLVVVFQYQKTIFTSTPKQPLIFLKFNRNTIIDSLSIQIDYRENEDYDCISFSGKLIFDKLTQDSFSDIDVTSNLKMYPRSLQKLNPNVLLKEITRVKYKDSKNESPSGYSFKFQNKENWIHIAFFGSLFEKKCSDIKSNIAIIPHGGLSNRSTINNSSIWLMNTRNVNFSHIFPSPDFQDAFHIRFEKPETIEALLFNGLQVQGEDTNRKNKNQFISLVLGIVIGALFSGIISLIIDLLIRKDKMIATETQESNPESFS